MEIKKNNQQKNNLEKIVSESFYEIKIKVAFSIEKINKFISHANTARLAELYGDL